MWQQLLNTLHPRRPSERRGHRHTWAAQRKLRLWLEPLEDRCIPSIGLSTSSWTPIGPAPILGYPELGQPVGRTEVLAPDPTNANVMYLAADNGGIWKTTNWIAFNGPTWTPLTDNQPSSEFGFGYQGLAVAPSNDQIIYGAVSGPGAGILRSKDGGQSWTSLANTMFEGALLGSLAVDATSPTTLYLSVWSGGTGGGGVYKSTDGGATWNNTTSSFHNGGASDLVIDPSHPNTVYAGLVFGPGAGIYKTTDGGNSWELLNNGVLSGSAVGATIRLALAPSPPTVVVPSTVYATVFDPALGAGSNGGGLPHRYRTTDGGQSWQALAAIPGAAESRYWHVVLAVDPTNAQDVFANGAYALYRSEDGGQTWTLASGHVALDNVVHTSSDDFTGLAFDHAGDWDLYGDRSIYRSADQGTSWFSEAGNLQITEFYDLTLDPNDPNNIYGIAQDQASALQFTGNSNGVWNYIGGGGETGKILIDPNNPQRVYEFNPLAGDWLVMVSDDGGQTFTGSLPNYVNSGGDYGSAYACQRSFAMDPSDPNHLLVGVNSAYFFETTDGGASWVTSGFLPINNGLTLPDITALTIAPNGTTFYAGASDGSFWVGTHQGGATIWTEADAGLLGVAGGAVVDIQVNPSDSNNLFVVTNGAQGNSVWLTSSGGIANPFTAWVNVTGNLPFQYQVATLAVDWHPVVSPPVPPAVYVGTSRGVYVSTDIPQEEPPPGSPPPSTHWSGFDAGLPITNVADLEYAPSLGILAAGTYGRGAFEILLHGSSTIPQPHFDEVACSDLPCIFNEATIIAVNPNPAGHVVATFSDLDRAAPLSEYRAVLQWGRVLTTAGIITFDADTGQFSVHVNETAPVGSYSLSITVYKRGVPASPVTADVMVMDAPLTATGATLAAAAGKSFTPTLATFQDTGGAEDPSHYKATMNWGDGTPVDTSGRIVAGSDGSLQVIASHTYARVGRYTAGITIADQDGSSIETNSTVSVTKTVPAAPSQPGFAARAGGHGANAGLAVATDSHGNVYVAGQYQGTADFGAGKTMVTMPGFGENDAFVAMYSSNGRLLWARAVGGSLAAKATGVAVDAMGNVYVTGDFQGTAHIGGRTFTAIGLSDSFVTKLDGMGNFIWFERFQELSQGNPGGEVVGSPVDGEHGAQGGIPLFFPMAPALSGSSFGDTASGIAVDSRGNVYVTGTFNQKVDFGGHILSSDGNGATSYLAKLDTKGHCLWAVTGAGGNMFNPSVAVDTAGNVYMLDSSLSTADTSATELISLEKLSPTGKLSWSRPVVDTANAHATGLAVDHTGKVLVTGTFVGTGQPVDFDPTATHTGNTDLLTPAQGSSNIFVEQVSGGGGFAWVQQTNGGSNFRTSTGVAVDSRGNVFLIGYFQTPTRFGDITLRGGGPTNTFLTELSSNGTFLLAAPEGGVDGDRAFAISVDPFGFPVFTGQFQGLTQIGSFSSLTVGGGMDTGGDADADGFSDIFIARLKLMSMRTPTTAAPSK